MTLAKDTAPAHNRPTGSYPRSPPTTGQRAGSREKQNGPQALIEPAGRPVDCLGLTKRWSLYVASHGNSRVEGRSPRVEAFARPTRCLHPYSPASVRTVASALENSSASKAPLRATSSKSQPPHQVLDSHTCHYNPLPKVGVESATPPSVRLESRLVEG
jgi:hypothetical protein